MPSAEAVADRDPYIEAQIAARQKPAVIKIRLLNYRSRYPRGLLIAVEGDDDKVVYSYWISRATPKLQYEFFVCGGKRGVRALRNLLLDDLGDAAADLVFMVDRDFDGLDGFRSTDHVFMLDRYSVENYLVERSVVDETIRVAFPGSGDPGTRAGVCDLFEKDFLAFLQIAEELNRRVFIARRLRLHIDDVMPDSLSKVASVQLGNVGPCGVSAEQALPFPSEPAAGIVSRLCGQFAALSPVNRHRGKFSYKFLRHWFDRLGDEYRNPRLGLFPLSDQDSRIKSDEMRLGALACRSKLPEGFEAFFARYDSLPS